MKSNNEISIYYDGACYLCSSEIDIYKRKDTDNKIKFVDISDPKFQHNTDQVSIEDLHRFFHVKTKSGGWIRGVDAFNKIWQVLGIFKPLQVASELWLTRPLMEAGYLVFTKLRPYLPKKKGCETGSCHI